MPNFTLVFMIEVIKWVLDLLKTASNDFQISPFNIRKLGYNKILLTISL